VIKIKYHGRLGNKIFQYIAARAFADKHNIYIQTNKPSDLITDHNTTCSSIPHHYIKISNDNYLMLYQEPKVKFDCGLMFDDYFQSAKIIKTNLTAYSSYLTNEQSRIAGTFIHLRLGDLIDLPTKSHTLGRCPPIKYFEMAIEDKKCEEPFVISTDRPDHHIFLCLKHKYHLKHYSGTPEETIKFGSRFTTKIVSLGTFSWLIAFINGGKVITPDYEQYQMWHDRLYIPDHWKILSIP
jgi:hypothetical protein